MRGDKRIIGMGERFALCLVAAALALKIMVPAGWMPGEQGRWIELCTARGSLTAFIDAAGERRSGDPADTERAKQHCAFAGFGAALDHPPIIDTLARAVPIADPIAPRVPHVAIGRGLAAPPPPSTGPPAFV